MSRRKQKSGSGLKAAGWIAGSLLLVGLAVAAGVWLEQNTRITSVAFTGHHFTEEETLYEVIDSPIGILADSVDYTGLFESIQTLPYVRNVTLNMGLRGALTFNIQERQPLALLVENSNRMYVGEDGVKLPLIPGKIEDVPLLYGFPAASPGDTLQSDAFKQVEAFLTEARKNEFGWITISEVAWNGREGVVALSYENGVRLVFGQDDFSKKLRNWEVFYKNVIARKGIGSFERIDLRFNNQIVTQES